MSVYTYLDATTAHLTKDEMDVLSAVEDSSEEKPTRSILPRVIRHTYGAWVNVPTDIDGEADRRREADRAELYPNLQRVIEHARTNGCFWINFDQSADRIEGLPVFDW